MHDTLAKDVQARLLLLLFIFFGGGGNFGKKVTSFVLLIVAVGNAAKVQLPSRIKTWNVPTLLFNHSTLKCIEDILAVVL